MASVSTRRVDRLPATWPNCVLHHRHWVLQSDWTGKGAWRHGCRFTAGRGFLARLAVQQRPAAEPLIALGLVTWCCGARDRVQRLLPRVAIVVPAISRSWLIAIRRC